MKKILYLFSFFLFLLVLPFSYSLDYPYVGFNDFIGGTGFFNEQLTDSNSYTRVINNPVKVPLVSDLDGDGINEIIVQDGANIRLYHDKELTIVDSYAYISANTRWSNLLTYDIDGDGYTEVMLTFQDDQKIDILEYNGTTFGLQISISYNAIAGSDSGETIIQCLDTEKCALFYVNSYLSGAGSSSILRAVPFNSTAIGATPNIMFTSAVNHVLCFPQIRYADTADYDGDTEAEYILTFIDANPAGNEVSYLYTIDQNQTPIKELMYEKTASNSQFNFMDGATLSCKDMNFSSIFTPPLAYNFDGAVSNGMEIVYGYMIDNDEFVMKSYNKNLGLISRHPDVLDADGVIVSNVFRANVFIDTGTTDFCVVGYDSLSNEVDLLCSSLITGGEGDEEFQYDTSALYNISQFYDKHHVHTGSAQHSTTQTSGNDLSEIVNSYGVFEISYVGNNHLELIFQSPLEDAVLISVDPESVGRDDLLALTDTNLWYIDDDYSTSGAEIDWYYIDPCLDATWKLRENETGTLEVRIRATDIDNDQVSTQAILYAGESFNQTSGWTANASDGTTFTFSFSINQSIPVGTLSLFAMDTSNPLEVDQIDLTFSVGSSGVQKGECYTEVDILTAEEQADIEGTTGDTSGLSFTQGVDDLNDAFGLGLGRSGFWLFVMVLAGGVISFSIYSKNPAMFGTVGHFGILLIGEVMLLLFGVKLGFISVFYVFIFVFIGSISAVFWVRQMYFPSKG